MYLYTEVTTVGKKMDNPIFRLTKTIMKSDRIRIQDSTFNLQDTAYLTGGV